MTRKQVVEPDRLRPAPVDQKVDQYISGTAAWNMVPPAGAAAGASPAAQPQPAAVEERTMEIWSTPQGFLKAALANNATSQAAGSGSEVTFTAGNHKYVGTINGQNQVEKIQTWINNPILGDTLVETTRSHSLISDRKWRCRSERARQRTQRNRTARECYGGQDGGGCVLAARRNASQRRHRSARSHRHR